MPAAEFLAPATLGEALDALGDEGTHLLGGGTALALLMKTGLLDAARVVWLGKVPELGTLAVREGALHVGGGVTLHRLATSPVVHQHCPSLAAAAGLAANIRVRAVATIGGHLVHADPRQDCPPVLLAAGAIVHLASAGGTRSMAVDDFLVSFMETEIQPDEVLTEVEVPLDQARREAYVRFAPGSQDDFPTASAAAVVRGDASGALAAVRIGVGAAGSRATLHCFDGGSWGTSAGMPDDALADALAAMVAAEVQPVADHRGSAEYRRHVTGVTVARALRQAWGDGVG